ncbi:hypothetical protein DVS28_b0345 (plasmid) [Euzebya pacifica]|uniref:Uncharacterized protein n=1 Tax=Euzebya pacifica TaxID=1608957 RepID=A0A346Y6L8_9ACTN|nr:hypothetical protein [Euzebya pacifica]AXV10115.1 hypothetical protein DVS28_b0345 [Euzebya pacifica]
MTQKTLSMASRAVTGMAAVNGWRFWRTADGTFLADVRTRSTS